MSFSAYLLGTWENGRILGLTTTIQIVNPTTDDLRIVVAFFDGNEKPLRLLKSGDDVLKEPLSPNDLCEINIPVLDALDPQRPVKGFGVVKIISLNARDPRQVKEGIVGFQRHVFAVNRPTTPPDLEAAFSESPLAAIPLIKSDPSGEPNIWEREYQRILSSFP